MELEQLHLNLLDLRQLYCLMQSCFSGQQNARAEILGERTCLLFKSLLDDATARVFMAYSEIEESQSPRFSETENSIPKPKLVFEAPPRIVSTQTQNKSIPPMAANSELSINPEKRHQCRNCARKDTMKQKTSALNNRDVSDERNGLKHFHAEDEQRKQTREPPENVGTTISSTANSFVSCSSASQEFTRYDLHGRREKKRPETAVDYSEDISDTVKKINAHIRALKLRNRSRNHTLESGRGRLSRATNSSPFKSFTKSIPNQELCSKNGFSESESVNRAIQLHGSLGRTESLSQSANRASRPGFVHGFVIPSVPEDIGRKGLTRKIVGSNPSPNGSSSGRSLGKENRRRNMSRQIVIRPTLLDRPTTELMVLPNQIQNRTVGAKKRNIRSGRVVNRKKIEDETKKSQSSSSASSSQIWSTTGSSISWTSQQSGARSREYSSPRHVGPINVQRKHKPDSSNGSEKVIGGLRRLKNKLGLILHHHHHHHHHHHDGRLTRMDHRNSMWNHLGSLFHKTRPIKKYNKSRVKKAAKKDQVGHFHALAERFMRHVSKPGKSKPSKGKIRGLRKQKKKKLKWWKLPKKAKGFGYKKRRLQFI